MPSGKAFNIIKPKAFAAEILPTHFKTAKYSSFTRKLHRWGFMRQYRGDEAGAFYHKDFQKGRLDLVEKMSCYKQPETKPAAPVNPPQPSAVPNLAPRAPHHMPAQPQAPVDLNAAIEMEVTRRLKERINAAALSRQLAMMQSVKQQQHQQRDPRFMGWEPQQAAMQYPGAAFKYENAPYYGAGDVQAFHSLPPTNIQGAKTA